MTDIPAIMSAPMVRALLREAEHPGTGKSMTRRLALAPCNVCGGKGGTCKGPHRPSPWAQIHKDFNFRPIENHPDYLAGRNGIIYRAVGPLEFRPLKAAMTSKYPTVSLSTAGSVVTKNVHSLIARAWLGPRPSPEMEVRHLNGDRSNSRIENLDWGTRQDNWSDRREQGNGVHEDHHAAKITMSDADTIRRSSLSQRALARQFGISQSTIWDIKNGRIWVKAKPASGRNIAIPPLPRLWVRENCKGTEIEADGRDGVWYPADRSWIGIENSMEASERWLALANYGKNRGAVVPSIHMPRWASRLTLVLTETKVERLGVISEADALAEGVRESRVGVYEVPGVELPSGGPIINVGPRTAFACLWDVINGSGAWLRNPEVVALRFAVHLCNIDAMARTAA